VAEFVPGYEASSVYGLRAPKNTPTEVVDKLNREINTAFADTKIKAGFSELGSVVLASSSANERARL
jgi:tripartite-type tricarboxylate transporter receptor subunit TctC